MGSQAAFLLVIDRRAILLGLPLVLAGCDAKQSARVVARGHAAYFLWAGVPAPPWLAEAGVLYLLAGEVRAAGSPCFTPLRAVPRLRDPLVWLTVRTERLDWGFAGDGALFARILRELARWEAGGNRLIGLQIDFDAATRGLDGYANFLQAVRRALPPRYRLSVTGLMDWGAHADPASLARLGGTIDEAVIQTYQNRTTIPDYAAYLRRAATLPFPFRVAVVEGGEWREPPELARSAMYRGTVVFLLSPAHGIDCARTLISPAEAACRHRARR